MADFFFFTEANKLAPQISDQAFGEQASTVTHDNYLTTNKLTFTSDAKAFAITKSFIVVSEDTQNSSLLNIALFPFGNNNQSGLPIKYFIYKGIRNDSLLVGNIVKNATVVDKSNLLGIVKIQQDEINVNEGTNVDADKSVLGIGVLTLTDYLKKYFVDTSVFSPLLVDAGCELGLFKANSACSIQVVLDGYRDELLVSGFEDGTSGLLSFLKFTPNLTETNKIQLTKRFKNRIERERVLGYVDIVAFYGMLESQGKVVNLTGVDILDTYLNKFVNKNALYIDIRDNWGSSYNHYDRLTDDLNYAVSNDPDPANLVFTTIDYYTGWPILKLNSIASVSSNDKIKLKLPIVVGRPFRTNLLSVYSKNAKPKKGQKKQHFILDQQDYSGTVAHAESEVITLDNVVDTSNNFKANYFLLKLTRDEEGLFSLRDSLLKSTFPINTPVFYDPATFVDGEFAVQKVSSLFAPVQYDELSEEFYAVEIGLAIDKENYTFFTLKDEVTLKTADLLPQKSFFGLKELRTNWAIDNGLTYNNTIQNVGFLYQIFNNENSKIKDIVIEQNKVVSPENGAEEINFLNKVMQSSTAFYPESANNFQCISLTHEEFQELEATVSNTVTNNDFIAEHTMFVTAFNKKLFRFQSKVVSEGEISIGLPKIMGDLDNEFITLRTHPDAIVLADGEGVKFSATEILT